MGVHLPLSAAAQREARKLMLPSRNLLKPSDGAPVSIPSQEMAVGCYYIYFCPFRKTLPKKPKRALKIYRLWETRMN